MLSPKSISFNLIILLVLVGGLLFISHFFKVNDLELRRINQMVQCLEDGQLPCRWVNDIGVIYGSPVFNYVAPGPYYFAAVMEQLMHRYSGAAKLTVMSGLLFGGYFVYLLFNRYMRRQKSWLITMLGVFLAAITAFALALPLGMVWSIATLPLLLWGFLRLQTRVTIFNSLVISFGLTVLFLSRSPNFYISLLGFLVLFVWLLVKYKSIKMLGHLVLSLVLATALSAFFVVPMILERDLAYFDPTINEYVPVRSSYQSKELPLGSYQVLAGEANISNLQKGSDWMKFDVVSSDRSIVRLHIYYFPNWVVLANGTPLNFEYQNNYLGLMTIILGQGQKHIEMRLQDTPVRSFANILTILGAGAYVLFWLLELRRTRRFTLYYLKALRG